jgi:hypothetical protein
MIRYESTESKGIWKRIYQRKRLHMKDTSIHEIPDRSGDKIGMIMKKEKWK